MSDNDNIADIGGASAWTGAELDEEEIAAAVRLLEWYISEIKSSRLRGFGVAGVSVSGVGSTYCYDIFRGQGTSKVALAGAVLVLQTQLADELVHED